MSASLGLCTPGSGGGGGGGGGVCTAPPGGSPTCSGSGAATQGGGSTPSSGAGNPINLLNGNKYQEETDLAPLPGVLGLELKRYYNSQSTHPGLLGANWRMSYETVLYDLGSEIQIVQADGRRLMFQRGIGQSATLCSSPQPQDGQVRIEPAKDGKGQPTYYWRWADGRTLMFSSGSGGGYPLQSITAATGERVTLNYSPTGEITSIRDPQGRQLVFIYASAAEKRSRALKAIDTPLGRLTYSQDALGRLTEVGQAKDTTSAPFLSRLYHYEDRYSAGHPQALTGISVRGPDPQTHQITEQRLSTYVYNAAGLAILSTKGRPREMKDGKQVADTGIEQVEVAYLDKPLPQDVKVDRKTGEATPTRLGKVVLTNSLGQTTQVTSALIAGHFRLMEMRGPGCSTCGPGNMRYAYDAQGLLIRSTRLDDNGMPVRSEVTELDKYGRTARIGVQDYAASKAQPTRWIGRYEYPDVRYPDGSVAVAPQPSLIAQPSVIAGKEHTISVTYNVFGQVTRVTEAGFSPVDARAQASPDGTPLLRTTTTTYRHAEGRSLMERIDGPLGQGDMTRIAWDASGNFISSITGPGNLVTQEMHDPATGRPTQRIDAAGISTRFEYAQAAPDKPSLVSRAGQTTRFMFDSLGRVVNVDQTTDAAGGSSRDPDEHGPKSIQLHYDLANRLVAVTDAQGYKTQTKLDAEGQALVSGLYEPGQTLPLRATYSWYDNQRRLTKQLRPDGRIDTWKYDGSGELVKHVDGDNVQHLWRTNAAGGSARINVGPDGLMNATFWDGDDDKEADGDSNRTRSIDTPQVKRDDFGRAVMAWRPEQGLDLRTYDLADHLIREERLDRSAKPAGHVEQAFDAAGRQIQRLTFDAQGQLKQTSLRTYAGALLTQQRDDAQVTAYDYDTAGRVIATRITLNDEQGRPAYASTLRTRYDAQGEAEAKVLADGRVMHIQRQATGVASRINLQSAFWSTVSDKLERWLPNRAARLLQSWLPETTVVQDIDFHPYNGITGFTQGNGVRTSKTFDIAGRLTTLQIGAEQSKLGYGVGPRVRAIEEPARNGAAPLKVRYGYDGFGVLKTDSVASIIKTALNATAIPSFVPAATERDIRGRTVGDGRLRYAYTEDGQIETVTTKDGTRVAKYRYNAQGQRVSKTIDAAHTTTYYLWSSGRLVAEIEGSGEHAGDISAQYLYLSDEGKAAPIAKLESARAEGNKSGVERTLYVHSDHRGEPTAMTDASQHVVWRATADAWGFVVAADLRTQEAAMNIRLPGQYFDAETGLHDNWHRSYDARPNSALRGHYLTPDPMGYPDGPDAYVYAGGDPINNIDPMGLYEIDVHYYMTYFLAITAGVDQADAARMALADQYVDENELTRPTIPGHMIGSIFVNQPALVRYHFTEAGHDPSRTPAELAYYVLTGNDLDSYITRRVDNPDNPQLDRLLAASNFAKTDTNATCHSQVQLFGEYLHTFEDTFAHRDKDNDPYDATILGMGLGHASGGHNPDFTYNHFSWSVPGLGFWNTNEARTLEMEKEVFAKMQGFAKSGNASSSFAGIEYTLTQFNATKASEEGGDLNAKIDILNKALKDLGYTGIDLSQTGADKFDADKAAKNRDDALDNLKPSDYVGTILPQGTAPIP